MDLTAVSPAGSSQDSSSEGESIRLEHSMQADDLQQLHDTADASVADMPLLAADSALRQSGQDHSMQAGDLQQLLEKADASAADMPMTAAHNAYGQSGQEQPMQADDLQQLLHNAATSATDVPAAAATNAADQQLLVQHPAQPAGQVQSTVQRYEQLSRQQLPVSTPVHAAGSSQPQALLGVPTLAPLMIPAPFAADHMQPPGSTTPEAVLGAFGLDAAEATAESTQSGPLLRASASNAADATAGSFDVRYQLDNGHAAQTELTDAAARTVTRQRRKSGVQGVSARNQAALAVHKARLTAQHQSHGFGSGLGHAEPTSAQHAQQADTPQHAPTRSPTSPRHIPDSLSVQRSTVSAGRLLRPANLQPAIHRHSSMTATLPQAFSRARQLSGASKTGNVSPHQHASNR